MSLATTDARWSVPGIARPWMRSTYPDSAYGQPWRQSAGLGYAGLLMPAPTVAGSPAEALVRCHIVPRSVTGYVLPRVAIGRVVPRVIQGGL